MITRDHIEKAFDEKVEYRLCPWRADTGLRRPTLTEIKQRLLAVADIPSPQPNGVARLRDELLSAACLLETLAEDLPENDVSGVMMSVMAKRNRDVLAATATEGSDD